MNPSAHLHPCSDGSQGIELRSFVGWDVNLSSLIQDDSVRISSRPVGQAPNGSLNRGGGCGGLGWWWRWRSWRWRPPNSSTGTWSRRRRRRWLWRPISRSDWGWWRRWRRRLSNTLRHGCGRRHRHRSWLATGREKTKWRRSRDEQDSFPNHRSRPPNRNGLTTGGNATASPIQFSRELFRDFERFERATKEVRWLRGGFVPSLLDGNRTILVRKAYKEPKQGTDLSMT